MAKHTALIHWERGEQLFTDNKYSRSHSWKFDGGVDVPASSSEHIVPLPFSRTDAVDPEEALVAAVSSCHMLMFLSLAARKGLKIDSYTDEAEGALANIDGKHRFSGVTLRPKVRFAGEQPSPELLDELHHLSHEGCFIANSVNFEVTCQPQSAG